MSGARQGARRTGLLTSLALNPLNLDRKRSHPGSTRSSGGQGRGGNDGRASEGGKSAQRREGRPPSALWGRGMSLSPPFPRAGGGGGAGRPRGRRAVGSGARGPGSLARSPWCSVDTGGGQRFLPSSAPGSAPGSACWRLWCSPQPHRGAIIVIPISQMSTCSTERRSDLSTK